jgi:ribosomal RNA-processing protein 17
MGRHNSKNKSDAKSKSKPKPHKSKPSHPHHKRKVEIIFNPTDRVEYLTGFSTRKKERRAFGLAMQKVKDRAAKIEERKDNRDAQREKVEEIERSKAALRKGLAGEDDGDSDGEEEEEAKPLHKNEMFGDEHTQSHFGGLVSVTTTYGIYSDDESDSPKRNFFEREKHGSNHVDTEQKKAGNVQNYIDKVKGTMGGKKKTGGDRKHAAGKKGQHGAATMKGMGNATTLKMAKKTLAKFKAKGGDERGGVGASRGKKRKGRR